MARIGEGMLRAAIFMPVPALLRSLDANPRRVLQEAGLSLEAISSPERIISVDQAVRLLVVAAEHTGRPHFGLLAGQKATLNQLGLPGLRMAHAPSVGTAWRGVTLTLQLNGRANVPALTVRDGVAVLSFTPYRKEGNGINQVMDFTLAIACIYMRTLCGPKWAPTEAHLAHRAPVNSRPYRSFFKAPVHFGTNRTALLFPASWLERRVIGADAGMRRVIERTVADMLRQQDLALTTKVRRALFAQMTQNDVSVESVSRLVGLHKRTLNRRLAERDTSFAKLLGEVRFQIARQLLAETDLPFTDIAATLNYSEVAAFSRAFRSWAGQSPSAWRRVHMA